MSNPIVGELKNIVGKEGRDVSPSFYMQWLNGKLIDIDEGFASVEFKVRKEMCNPAKILHGGVIAGMLDEVAGIAVYSMNRKRFFSTLNLQVDYLRPANLHQKVIASARVIRSGNRVVHVHLEMKNDDKILAKASTNLIITSEKVAQSEDF